MNTKTNSATLWIWPSLHQLGENELNQCKSIMSGSELEALAGMSRAKRKQEFLAGHYLIRQALNQEASSPLAHWLITQNPDTGPELSPGQSTKLHFNLSHSAHTVCCLIGNGVEVGVDIEKINPKRRILELASNYFSENENQELRELKDEEKQRDHFYRLWTLKESVIKLHKAGLSLSQLRNLHFDNVSESTCPKPQNREVKIESYSFRFGNYQIALSVNGSLDTSPTIRVYKTYRPNGRPVNPEITRYTHREIV